MPHEIQGVFAAVATPLGPKGAPDTARFTAQCVRLLDDGCHGLALLGTTGEANSLGLRQRMALMEAARAVAPGVLLPGTSACSVADATALTSHAVEAGAKAVLLLPPFYYKNCSEEGLYRFYAQVIEAVGRDALRVILYHIPHVSQVPIPHDLIGRLMADFPGIVVGIKDSSGDLENMQTMARRFPDLAVFSGADPLLLPMMAQGGAGCITAAANLIAPDLRHVFDHWRDGDVAEAQARIEAWRALSTRYVQIPTVKALIAHRLQDPAWAEPFPPMLPLTEAEQNDIAQAAEALTG